MTRWLDPFQSRYKVKLVAFLVCCLLFGEPICGIGQTDELAAKSQRARDAMASGRYKEAISLYQDLVKALPAEPGIKMNLGIAHYMAGHYLESTRLLEAAVKADPKLTQALLFIGASQQRLGNAARAVPTLQMYVQFEGKDPRGRQLLGDALIAIQKFEEAAEQFEVLSGLEPENPKAWHGLGRSF